MRLKAAGRPGEDRLNVASGRPYPGTKCEVGIRHFRDSLLTRDGEDSWCRGWESNPHRPEARGILRPRKKGSEQRTWPIRCLFPCPRSPRSAVESEDYGHPDGHLFVVWIARLAETSTVKRCQTPSSRRKPHGQGKRFDRG